MSTTMSRCRRCLLLRFARFCEYASPLRGLVRTPLLSKHTHAHWLLFLLKGPYRMRVLDGLGTLNVIFVTSFLAFARGCDGSELPYCTLDYIIAYAAPASKVWGEVATGDFFLPPFVFGNRAW